MSSLPATRPPVDTTPAAPAHARPRVLVVDDEAMSRLLLRSFLSQEDFDVLEASSGQEALALARTERPDFILLDIMMPGMDGYEVVRRIKEDDLLKDVPVIILSGLAEASDKTRALELGAVDFVTKPLDREEVLARVRTQLRISTLTAGLQAANRTLLGKQRELDADLRAAADVQRALIPTSLPQLTELGLAWRFVPCSSLGGDIFNVQPIGEDEVALYLVDVSGHGVPAALVTVSVSQSLSLHAGKVVDAQGRAADPAKVVEALDVEYPIERFDKYFTMCYLVLDRATGEVRYCNAAHPRPVVVRRDGRTELLEVGGTIVGMGGVMPYEEGRFRLEEGDRLFLYTDGFIEAENGEGEPFGEDRLEVLLSECRDRDVQATCDALVAAVRRWREPRAADDDQTILGLEYRGPS